VTVDLDLFAVASGGVSAWNHQYAVTPQDGYYALQVGPDAALTTVLGANADLWMQISVNGSPLTPREYLGAGPRGGGGGAVVVPTVGSPTGACTIGELVLDTASNRLRACTSGLWDAEVQLSGAHRTWDDGTFASTCDAYRNPAAGFAYTGATGSGVYAIDPDGDGTSLDVYCDMTTADGFGWTRVLNAVTVSNWANVRVNQGSVLAGTPDAATNAAANGWVGLSVWPSLGTTLRQKCAGGTAGPQDASAAFTLNPAANYAMSWGIGGGWNTWNEGMALSTTDFDRDMWSSACATYTGHESSGWGWHRSCHLGSAWFGDTGAPICQATPSATMSNADATHTEWYIR